MKSSLASLLATLALSCATASSAPADADAEIAIRSVLQAQAAAWNRGDIDGYMDGYARDSKTEFVGGDTLTRGWQTVRDRYKKKYDSRAKMGTLNFSEVQITLLCAESALVTGRWKLARQNDQPHGRFTLLWRKRPEGWRIVHDHSSAAEH